MEKNVLEVDGVQFSFGLNRILSGIYLRCEQGQIVGLLGRNGSGKSSLMKVIFSALDAESKSIRVNGAPQSKSFFSPTKINYLPQDHLIPEYITIKQAFILYRVNWLEHLKEFPEIEKLLNQKPKSISGGELRLVEIMLILFSKSEFCLLDEPFSGLSPVMIERVTNLLSRIKASKGIIITDHLYRHVASVSDAIYVLTNGQTRKISEMSELVKYGYISESPA